MTSYKKIQAKIIARLKINLVRDKHSPNFYNLYILILLHVCRARNKK